MAAKLPAFTQEELAVDEALGFPKAYARICRSTATRAFTLGPPLSFIPYALQPPEALRVKELNQMFPVIDLRASLSADPRAYVNFLWEQLDHLGNAGFDPALFRVDPYGNVLHLRADPASPLAWDIDHWFPCSRGGKTIPSNLRILQWQVCRKKKNKLDFLIPWWDHQLGISVNQFLSIFASKNSDFRFRALSFLFPESDSEELNECHSFPEELMAAKRKLGLAPAAIVPSRDNSCSNALTAESLTLIYFFLTAASRLSSKEDKPELTIQKFRTSISTENYESDRENNPYITIARAGDALRLREDAKRQQREIKLLDEQLNELKRKNDDERIALQDLEAVLTQRRRRVEKCRRLSETQASYRALLEKMIRDAMHKSVVYKEQLRLNQVASSALMARLEAQRAICDSSENDLRRKYKVRDEMEKQALNSCEQAQKTFRTDNTLLYDFHGSESNSSKLRERNPTRKELRVFLEEEQKASEAGIPFSFDEEVWEEYEPKEFASISKEGNHDKCKGKMPVDNDCKLNKSALADDCNKSNRSEKIYVCGSCVEENIANKKLNQVQNKELNFIKTSASRKQWHLQQNQQDQEEKEKEEYKNQIGKGNIEKWLKLLLENAEAGISSIESPTTTKILDMQHQKNLGNPNTKNLEIKPLVIYPPNEKYGSDQMRTIRFNERNQNENRSEIILLGTVGKESSEIKVKEENKEGSIKGFISLPSSPSIISGMRKSVDRIWRKSRVNGDEHPHDNSTATNSNMFIRSFSRIKKGSKA
ncbi:hypothetical protein AXF42_Ash007289 [Apostasia shenzhenica]|uniref:Uncharacterized protein n=1 Tax=Apostasia shenzhenica TaxID=1088818 RepID=A0A2I0B9S3_9ASPA|nr:hypothetical protein AXF42_Ash007289 [Apostasia shenzhenica]